MFRSCLFFSIVIMLLAPLAADAQQARACEAAAEQRLLSDYFAEEAERDDNVIIFEAGAVEAALGDEPAASLTGGVVIRRGDRLAGADSAVYDPGTQSLKLSGDVRYEDPETLVTGTAAEFAYLSGRIRFDGAEFELGQGESRGAASILEINQDGRLILDEVSYTTCPPGSEDWLIQAGNIELDTAAGVGTARNVKLRFQGVPILYTPYFSFPLGDARKSGILLPRIGSTERSGNELSVPYYWNIAANYDATFTPRLLTDRGLQLNSEFRYLTRRNEGITKVDYLPDDSLVDSNRYLLGAQHQTLFDNGWRNLVDFSEVSDAQYFEDLGGSLNLSSITHLNRSLLFDYYGNHWSIFGRAQDYQTIDESIVPTDQPYRRVPRLRLLGSWPDQVLGLWLGLDSELVNFERNVGVTGWRFDIAPEIEWPVQASGWYVTPGIKLQHTRYDLQDTLPGEEDSPSRTLPIARLDTGMIFERSMRSSSNRIQTLEPRILYVHVPFRDQTQLPVFDTIVPDLNLVQLYRENRFLGVDRIGDTDQLSLGLTTRVLDVDTGRELVSATIGQARYLSSQDVTLPNQPAAGEESSDYIAELRFLLYENWNFDVGHQWRSGDQGTTRSEARIQYRPQSNKIINLAYRFRRDSIEQGDISLAWPLTRNWNFVGRYNYSIRDRQALDQFFGLEYESCCWGVRLVSRRFLSTRDGTRDTSIGLQLVLKGMASVGTSADALLEGGVHGYRSGLK